MSKFTNVGTDEDGNVLGNCNVCGSSGVLIHGHVCSVPTEEMLDVYTSSIIVKKLGIPLSKFRTWHIAGYVMPTYPCAGQGRKSYYTFGDLCRIVLFDSLVASGLKRSLAAKIILKTIGKDFTTFTIIRHKSVFMHSEIHLAGVGIKVQRLLEKS